MAKKQASKRSRVMPLQERLRIARFIDEYRAAHPRMPVREVLKEPEVLKMTGPVRESHYWLWRKRLELAEAKGERVDGEEAKVEHFPLALIPEKPKPTRREYNAARLVQLRSHDEDKQLAASLLEIATRLLKR